MFDLVCDTFTCNEYVVDNPDTIEDEAFCPKCHHSLRFQDRAFRQAYDEVVTNNPNMR
jgi:hypothetical protein